MDQCRNFTKNKAKNRRRAGWNADAADGNPAISAKGKHPNNSFPRKIVQMICFLGKWTSKRSKKDKSQQQGSIEMDKI